MSDKSLDEQLAELLAQEQAKDRDLFGDERLFGLSFSHEELSAIKTGLHMIYQMGAMISLNADEESESEQVDNKNKLVRKLLQRVEKAHENCPIDHNAESED